jgi:hypothetical protein
LAILNPGKILSKKIRKLSPRLASAFLPLAPVINKTSLKLSN